MEVADRVVDCVLEELLSGGGEIIMRDFIHHAYMECETSEIEKLLTEAVVVATRDHSIHNLVMRSVRFPRHSQKCSSKLTSTTLRSRLYARRFVDY